MRQTVIFGAWFFAGALAVLGLVAAYNLSPNVRAAVSGVITVSARIAGVTSPINSNDAATKGYVDALIGGGFPTQIEGSNRGPDTPANALATCRNLGGGWRLPSLDELEHFVGSVGSVTLLTRSPAVVNSGNSQVGTFYSVNMADATLVFTYYTSTALYRCVK